MTISSFTLRYLPGELQFVQNSSIIETEENEQDTSLQLIDDPEPEKVEKKDGIYEEEEEEDLEELKTDEERYERIGKIQQERINNLEKFCNHDPRLNYMKATIWFRNGLFFNKNYEAPPKNDPKKALFMKKHSFV